MPAKPGLAEKLADWTRLSIDSFKILYGSAFAAGEALTWNVLVSRMEPPVPPQTLEHALILAACREAEAKGFIERLLQLVINFEGADRPADELKQLLKSAAKTTKRYGEMQRMINPAQGMLHPHLVRTLDRVLAASGFVELDGTVQGTAWLVKSDLVITAAHVVLDLVTADDGTRDWSSLAKPGLSICFPKDPFDETKGFRRVGVLGQAFTKGSYAFPYGVPPGLLDTDLDDPRAADRLDYALLRLSNLVHEITPLDITAPGEIAPEQQCFVSGYAGGRAMRMSTSGVASISPSSGRIFYYANTVAGMSGGCCVSGEGVLIGLHEGGPPIGKDAAGTALYANRAVGLSQIRKFQLASGRDPLLLPPRSDGIGFENREFGDEMFNIGLRLAGIDHKLAWIESVRALIAAEPPAGLPMPAFHPWFPRPELEAWIDAAAAQSLKRILFVNGEAGTGKSFVGRILAAKMNEPDRDLTILCSTPVTSWSWTEAVRHLIATDTDSARTSAGAISYDAVPQLIEQLGRLGSGQRPSDRPRVVVVDFEDAGSFRSDRSPWRAFVQALAAAPWARLVLIGLPADERDAIDDALYSNPATEAVVTQSIQLDHVSDEELGRYLVMLSRARHGQQVANRAAGSPGGVEPFPPLKPSEAKRMLETLRRVIAPVWPDAEGAPKLPPELKTTMAALFAIALDVSIAKGRNA